MACRLFSTKTLYEPMLALSIRRQAMYFNGITNKIQTFSFKKMSSAKSWTFCLALNVLKHYWKVVEICRNLIKIRKIYLLSMEVNKKNHYNPMVPFRVFVQLVSLSNRMLLDGTKNYCMIGNISLKWPKGKWTIFSYIRIKCNNCRLIKLLKKSWKSGKWGTFRLDSNVLT